MLYFKNFIKNNIKVFSNYSVFFGVDRRCFGTGKIPGVLEGRNLADKLSAVFRILTIFDVNEFLVLCFL